ncbi:MAG: chromate transporter [Ezakiella sp.]|nr:chromate transporter [Ezakiella sp.]
MILILFEKFFKIGLFSFGGGYAMLPLFQKEFIASGIITEEKFYDIISLSEMTPGSFAVNAATFIGNEKAGIIGSIISTIAVTLPSLIVLIIMMKLLSKYEKSELKEKIFRGLRPAVLGFIASAIMILIPSTFVDIKSILIFIASMALIISNKVHPILIIFIMGLVGMIL